LRGRPVVWFCRSELRVVRRFDRSSEYDDPFGLDPIWLVETRHESEQLPTENPFPGGMPFALEKVLECFKYFCLML